MKRLLIVEDDMTLAAGLVRVLSRRNFLCLLAHSSREALEVCQEHQPTHILLDLNLGNETTQDLVAVFKKQLPHSRIVMLTGFGTIPSTVRAIKEGASQYLCKPATPDQIEKALNDADVDSAESVSKPLWDLEKAHILKILEESGGNITQAAKNLGLHRRTLQRRLKKI